MISYAIFLILPVAPLHLGFDITAKDFASIRGYDLSLSFGGPASESGIDKLPNLVADVYKLPMAFSLSTSKKTHRKFSMLALRMKIVLKDGRSILVDQEGYILVRSRDLKRKAEYEIVRIQYMAFSIMWHDTLLRKDGLLRDQ